MANCCFFLGFQNILAKLCAFIFWAAFLSIKKILSHRLFATWIKHWVSMVENQYPCFKWGGEKRIRLCISNGLILNEWIANSVFLFVYFISRLWIGNRLFSLFWILIFLILHLDHNNCQYYLTGYIFLIFSTYIILNVNISGLSKLNTINERDDNP